VHDQASLLTYLRPVPCRLLRLGLPSSPSPEVWADLRHFVAQLRHGAERR
jgi:hypothetical protein